MREPLQESSGTALSGLTAGWHQRCGFGRPAANARLETECSSELARAVSRSPRGRASDALLPHDQSGCLIHQAGAYLPRTIPAAHLQRAAPHHSPFVLTDPRGRPGGRSARVTPPLRREICSNRKLRDQPPARATPGTPEIAPPPPPPRRTAATRAERRQSHAAQVDDAAAAEAGPRQRRGYCYHYTPSDHRVIVGSGAPRPSSG